jgi:hypothetical protein
MPRKPKWAMKANGIPDDPRAALETLADHLLTSSVKNAPWLAAAIKRRLAGETNTIDKALSLPTTNEDKRRVPASADDIIFGKRVFLLKELGALSWNHVCDRLQEEGFPPLDESTVRQKYTRVRSQVIRALVDGDLTTLDDATESG